MFCNLATPRTVLPSADSHFAVEPTEVKWLALQGAQFLAWTPSTLAFWDNRSTQHYASSDYWPRERVMERITIIGDTPR